MALDEPQAHLLETLLVNQSHDANDDEVGCHDEVKQPRRQQDGNPCCNGQYRDKVEVKRHRVNSFISCDKGA